MEKKTINDLAIFSGPRLFDSLRSIGQLTAPPVEAYLEILRTVYEARNLTNDGALVRRLEANLCDYHGVQNCIALANAGLGLTMLAQVFAGGRAGEVIMPAFSFRGLPHFVRWAGQIPRFCDVDETTHGLDPASVAAVISDRTTSILAVANFNSPGCIDELSELGDRHGIPVFLDSVYGLGCTYKGVMLGGYGRAEVYSLHATKLLNGFEGGYVTTNDDNLAEVLRWQRNFTFPGWRPETLEAGCHVLGTNAKLNELHAGMALLSLERLQQTIERNKSRYKVYQEIFNGLEGLTLLSCGDETGEQRNYEMVIVELGAGWPLDREQTLSLLRAEGCAIGPYYSPALHRSEHCPPGCGDLALPVAESLSNRYLQMPVGEQMSTGDINALGGLLRFARRHGEAISARLKTAGRAA
jgi:dTDP-4-amino-4,6-dideoxygalactose transaminase